MLINHKNRGYTLIELLVGLAVGLIVITGLLIGWGYFAQQTGYLTRTTVFHQDARAALQLISQDIRRATPAGPNVRAFELVCLDTTNRCGNPVGPTPPVNPVAHGDCITFQYTRADTNGGAGTTVFSGYRVANGSLETWAGTTTSNGQCSATTNWAPILTPGISNIQSIQMRISTQPDANTSILNATNSITSRCLEVDVEGASATDTNTRCALTPTERRIELLMAEVTLSGTARLQNTNNNFSFSELVQVRNFEILE